MDISSFRLNSFNSASQWSTHPIRMHATLPSNHTAATAATAAFGAFARTASEGGGHPSLGHLALLVFEAVMEVVCVSLPGYMIARAGMFDQENQKFIANLNVSLFTPCLIFTKLASQLTLSKIAELAVIPVIFLFMTLVSYFCSLVVVKLCGFEKRAGNFVIAMGVFGNSNSLPISLVMSLAMTISGLHWDRIPGDNDGEVAARGILYLLIFQQLGQLLRWTWGYHVLLAPVQDDSDASTYRDNASEDGDMEAQQADRLLVDPFESPQFENSFEGLHRPPTEHSPLLPSHVRYHERHVTSGTNDSTISDSGPSGQATPFSNRTSTYPSSTSLSTQNTDISIMEDGIVAKPGPDITSFPSIDSQSSASRPAAGFVPKWYRQARHSDVVTMIMNGLIRVAKAAWEFMNPPLWAMLVAVVVASIPSLQSLFFTQGTFINTSVTRAVSQSGNVAVPLILVVLGANLANNTSDTSESEHHDKQATRILIASIFSRMVLPFVFTAPVLAVAAKYLTISILDDPIFVVVCFLLAGAPSALQLAQICQINQVFEDVVTRVLFWSYVIVILPSTLLLVITAIEVVHWAA